MNKHTLLTIAIFVGLIVGAIFGEVLFRSYGGAVPAGWLEALEFIGKTFFMGLLKMVLIPLIATSVIVGVASIGDPSKLGKVGACTVGYYFATMLVAVIIGVMLVSLIKPGASVEKDFQSFRDEQVAKFKESGTTAQSRVEGASGTGLWGAAKNIFSQLVPSNPVKAAAEGKMLSVISFSLIFGIVLTVIGEKGKRVTEVFDGIFTAVMKMVEWILWLAPIGVFALLAWTVARIGVVKLTGPLIWYIVTVIVGLLIHGTIVLPAVLWLFGKSNPYRYMWQMKDALMTAFGTDSSSATLPVTIETAQREGGVSKRSAEFVLPLGATVNMDGTALYEAVAVVFLFQCFGIPLGGTELGIIVFTATLAAVGAAGIPSAGLVTMVIVVEAVNGNLGADKHLPLAAIGIILGIDRILDMCRTTVNVWGDAVGAKIITRIAPDAVSD